MRTVFEGVCHLVSTPEAFEAPTRSQVAEQDAARQEHVYNLRLSMLSALEEKKKAFSHKAQGAKQEDIKRQRDERRRAKGKGKPDGDDENVNLFSTETSLAAVEPPSLSANHSDDKKDVGNAPFFTTVSATPDVTPSPQSWFVPRPGESLFTDLDSARAAGVWIYPENLVERSRCATFRRLWEDGMYLGQGIKFGGEFLGYPGDPLRYHSHFVTTTMQTPDRVIRPLELVAFGRLGTATKKAHLLCCFDEEGSDTEDEGDEQQMKGDANPAPSIRAAESDVNKRRKKGRVDCYSLEWGNFG